MKKLLLGFLIILSANVFAQQKGISYQAVIINPNSISAPGYNAVGTPLANKSVCMSFQILNAASQTEYQETQTISTDQYGMVNLVIGTGTKTGGTAASLAAVTWSLGGKSLVVAVNTEGTCSSYTEISRQALNYVPYAMYADDANIKDGFITTAKLADGSVTDAKVAAGINKTKVGLGNVDNTSDANKQISTATQAALNLKEDAANKSVDVTLADVTNTKFPTEKAVKAYVDGKVAAATIADANSTTKGKIQLAGDLGGTAAAPTVPGLATKANISSLSTVATSGSYNDLTNKPTAYALPTASVSALGGVKVGSNLSIDADGVLSAIASNNASSLTGIVPIANGGTSTNSVAGIKSMLGLNTTNVAIGDQSGQTNQASGAVAVGGAAGANNQGASSVAIGYVAGYNNQGNSSIAIGPNAAQSGQGQQSVAIGYAAGQNGQGAYSVALGSFAGNVQAANSIALNATGASLNPTTTGFYVAPIRNASQSNSLFYNSSTNEITYGSASSGTVSSVGTIAGTSHANGASITSGVLSLAPADGTNGGIITTGAQTIAGAKTFNSFINTPIYASTPQALTAGATIDWNPALGLNASVTLNQNSTLNFTTTPNVGTYGTVILTQDATGGRTITLPTIAGKPNKVLGSTSTTTVALSTAANSKDILNFYYDGTNCYWNIGQGYGQASAGSSTNLATSVTGTLPVANGGTGATTLTGVLKGNGTGAITAAIAGTDYVAPASLANYLSLTGGTLTGNLSGTTINAPIFASTPQALTPGVNITWTTTSGLNASVTLNANSTLAFGATPPIGVYGTLIVTQPASGGPYTLTLPTALTNKVLGSSASTITLSTTANAKDILTFYYDGAICYWNVGLGYGEASTSTASTNLANQVTGTLPVANGGTGLTSTPSNGQIDIGNGTGFTRATLTAGTAITITNTAGTITIAAAVRPTTDQITANAAQTSFNLSQTPLNGKVWMFINGVRTNNNAYTINGTTITYTPANNNNYTIVVGDRIQFDYAY
jgi:hypothetical protein